jgi:predicted SAM-dependent methyltransferase
MNLIDLFRRNAKTLKVNGKFDGVVTRWGDTKWRSILVLGGQSSFTISGIFDLCRFKSFPPEIGWYISLRKGKAGQTGKAIVNFQNGADVISRLEIPFCEDPVPVRLPWPVDGRLISLATVLNVSFEIPSNCSADLFVQRALDRSGVLAFAKGIGIEIGPGPKPQVFSSEATSVRYLEEMPLEKWKELYDKSSKYGTESADFSNYILGSADSIPAEPETLDFIFSSHVFEHLANPLGHLKRWNALLKKAGVVIAVVPDMHATKDMYATPSTLAELKQEQAKDIWRPERYHYERFMKLRGGVRPIDEVMEEQWSIHVHYYDRISISNVLEVAVAELGYSSYSIVHADNHKDFHFCLWK